MPQSSLRAKTRILLAVEGNAVEPVRRRGITPAQA